MVPEDHTKYVSPKLFEVTTSGDDLTTTITTKTTFDLMVDKEKVVHVVIVVVIKKHIIVVISSVSIFCLGFCSRNPSNPGTSRHSLACRPA